jgi:uncharacterized protein (TIGR03435 family)
MLRSVVRTLIKRLTGIVAVLGVMVPCAFGQGNPQPGGPAAKADGLVLPGAAYEVATIRPTKPSDMGGVRTLPSGEFISNGMSVKTTVGTAYGKFSFQILGGPAWFESDKYDIEAKPDNVLAEQLSKLSWEQRAEVQGRMLQALLEDRLKLKVHVESRELPLFALVVDKGGLKIHETKAGAPYRMMVGNGKIVCQGVSMDELAETLTGNIDHIVSNKTGLKGTYDFTLHYSDDVSGADSSSVSIYTAVQEQLGLKLESTKAPAPVLVIDHVERPSEN